LVVAGFGGLDQSPEDGAGVFVFVYRTLGVPLDCQDEVVWVCAFDGFYDAVIGAAGYYFEAIADYISGLVVARVGGDFRGQLNDLREP
jgi:hypothetical protein